MALSLVVASANGQTNRLDRQFGPAYWEISTEVETPHLKWGKPLAGGPIRILIIAPEAGQRETVELWQRLAMQFTAVATAEAKVLGRPAGDKSYPSCAATPAVEARLRQAVQKNYDVIVVAVSWKILPADVAAALLAKVKAGAGLVILPVVTEEPAPEFKTFQNSWRETARPGWLLAGSRLDELPSYGKNEQDKAGPSEKVFACYQVERGRIADVKIGGGWATFLTPSEVEKSVMTRWDFEDQQASVTKLLLWTAGRVPAVSLSDMTLSADGSTAQLVAEAAVPAVEKNVNCRLTVRDRWGGVVAEATKTLDLLQAKNVQEMRLPPVKGGRHRAEIRLLNARQETIWWGVWLVTVKPSFGIERLTLDSNEVQPGQSVKGKVELVGQPAAGAELIFTATDANDRVVIAANRPAATGAFAFELPHPIAVYHELAVRLTAGQRVFDEKRVPFAVPLKGPGWDDFSFAFWHTVNDNWMGQLMRRELAQKYCADTIYSNQYTEEHVWGIARDGLWVMPYATRLFYMGTDLIRSPCLSDPDYIKYLHDHMHKVGGWLRKFRPAGYSLGDECFLTWEPVDVCFSPHCQASFRNYLKRMYPSLEALNAEWGTSLKDWSEASPITKKDALAKNQIARWVDHRMHMNSVFANAMRIGREATRESDPLARVGFDGPLGNGLYNGHDLWKLSQVMDLWGAYAFNHDWYEAQRSFDIKDCYGAAWFGGYGDTRWSFHNWPWWIIQGGMKSAWWYAAGNGGIWVPLAPDYRPYPDFLDVVKEIRRLKSGVGKLILHADREPEPVAVHYSMESHYAQAVHGLPKNAMRFRNVLSESRLTFRHIAPQQIASGKLAGFRVLVLSGSLAISDAEAAAMRTFVENGGILVADVRPGITDQHGKLRKAGALDSLFGVKQDLGQVGRASAIREVTGAKGPLAKAKKLLVDSAVSLDPTASQVTAASADGLPYFIVHAVGKGKTILLNAGVEGDVGVGEALAAILQPQRIVPRATVVDAKGKFLAAPALYRDGKAYVAIFDANAESEVQVRLPGVGWCYLADEGQSLGRSISPKVPATKAVRNRVLVSLPYEVQGLEASHTAGPDGREHHFSFALTTTSDRPEFHVLRIRVTGPDGRVRSCYGANLSLAAGRGQYTVPLAHNDLHGQWTLVATDVTTGVETKVKWTY